MEDRADNILYTTIGEVIRRLREKANLTLTQLAHLSGISKAAISKIENGETKRPEFRTIKPIAEVLDIPHEQIVESYIEVEQRIDVLQELLLDAIKLSNKSLLSKIALRFLQSPYEESYTLIERLYQLTNEVRDGEIRLSLYDLIIKYARERGMQRFLAKGLLQKYLIERLDLKKLEDSYRAGEEILHYTDFLSREEKITFYFRMGLHAHNIKRYKECIELCMAGLAEDTAINELKARAHLAMINSLLLIGQYDEVERQLKVYETYRFGFVEESAKLTRAIVKAKKREYDRAVPMLRACLDDISEHSRIHVVNELLSIYLEIGDLESVSSLLHTEDRVLNFDVNTPYKHASLGAYYRYKGAYQFRAGMFEEGMKSYQTSLLAYGEISAHQEITECMNDILSFYTTHGKSIDFYSVQQLKEVYNKLMKKKEKK
ncbi:helix-turn-helix transcriptional regulator [Brevibacillus humidisoli]|uniref:helix-turn-helix domain-containing protein n=1 Tax=Brevibacillus humidisoli TaxID=2895522 RepID=UPI001E3FC338|nr:helix-turn-helix transcriptional regulator [Brevibacillus humidisoli]UFJ40526.1 helix-turn-helix transcriptional regulator [Brevibacillus humidisoli]